MARNSRIEWTSHTFNPWWGCTKVSPACDNCYAETWARRTGYSGIWGTQAGRRELSEANWRQPYKWDIAAKTLGRRALVFCASMADVFEWKGGLTPLRTRLWETILQTPNLDWLLLTKRPHLISRLAPWQDDWPMNVWVGTTVENQRFAEKRIGHLTNLPCEYRFLSCEPLLEPIDLTPWLGSLDWVIVGGESAPKSKCRPINRTWVRHIRDQCVKAGVAFHFKQWGNIVLDDLIVGKPHWKSKQVNGRELDGRTWDELPRKYRAEIGEAA